MAGFTGSGRRLKKKLFSCGDPVASCDVKVLDEADQEVALEGSLGFQIRRRHSRSRPLFTFFYYTQCTALQCTQRRTATLKLVIGHTGDWAGTVIGPKNTRLRPPVAKMLPTIDGLLLPNSGGRAPFNSHHASRRRAGHKGDVGCHADGRAPWGGATNVSRLPPHELAGFFSSSRRSVLRILP